MFAILTVVLSSASVIYGCNDLGYAMAPLQVDRLMVHSSPTVYVEMSMYVPCFFRD